MASYADLAAVHPVVPGVCALTVRGREACVPLNVLKGNAHDLLLGDAGALAYTRDDADVRVIGVLTDTLLVREELLDWLGREVLVDVGGEGRFADPETALFDVQWRLNLLGQHVVTVAGSPRVEEPATDQGRMLRRRGLLTVLDVVLSDRWRGVLLPAAQLLAVTGALADSGTDTTTLDLQRSPGGTTSATCACRRGAWSAPTPLTGRSTTSRTPVACATTSSACVECRTWRWRR